jgi:hypothetical protein
METPATTVYVKKLIHVPADYENAAYRQMIYDRWQAEWQAAMAQLSDVNNSPHYGEGWRAD